MSNDDWEPHPDARPGDVLIHVKVSRFELMRLPMRGTREERDACLKDYLETLGLRPRHGCGTMEWQDAIDADFVYYRQFIPRDREKAVRTGRSLTREEHGA